MIKYAKVVDETSGLCQVGIGTNEEAYQKMGLEQLDVTQSPLDNQYYLTSIFEVTSQTPEYIAEQEAKAKETQRTELQYQIDELDKKRVRAIAEPSQKDENTTWLEFYTSQIQDLRAQIAGL